MTVELKTFRTSTYANNIVEMESRDKQAQKLGKDASENQNILDKIRLGSLKIKKEKISKNSEINKILKIERFQNILINQKSILKPTEIH